jgi:hypothetical protein
MRDKKRSTEIPSHRTTPARLDVDSDGCDLLLARMQDPKTRRAMKTAFRASAKQLGEAAVAEARRRPGVQPSSVEAQTDKRVAGRIQAILTKVADDADRNALAHSVKAGRTVYQSDPAGSGLTERISADGRRTLGRFVKRRFVPVRSSGSGRR